MTAVSRIMPKITAVSVLLFLLLGLAGPAVAADDITVRALFAKTPSEVRLQAPGRHISDAGGATLPAEDCRIVLAGPERGVVCGEQRLTRAPFVLAQTAAGTTFLIHVGTEKRRYSGALRLAERDQRLRLEITLPLDDYVAGVLAAETVHDEKAYLEALAVVVRHHALAAGDQGRRPVADDTRVQMFRGLPTGPRAKNLSDVARRTAAWTLSVDGRRAPAFYHACCGGRTRHVRDVWPKLASWSHLHGVRCADEEGRAWCRDNKWYRWNRRVPLEKWTAFLQSKFGAARAERRHGNPLISLTGGGSVPAWRFRMTLCRELGWNTAPSDDFAISNQAHIVMLDGKGFGHRVGLCQAGALAQAKAGRSAEDILHFYFPEARIW
ncbi:MAG: SpoIID/LytB domain-containing protein [Candidatus Lernaella stagnicola]|nr:SpoIID/LytB domain-containing protein [Candidatus Lernaella stagnicola]